MQVGVDLERADLSAAADIFDGALSSVEHAGVDPSDPMGVVRLWCRKEALLKAEGVGLAIESLTGIDVRNEVVQGWHLADLPLHGDWVGAIATRRRAAPTIFIDGDVALHSRPVVR
ncbi:MAG: 4-phosphopantetheinyl transferase superfamily [Ilumatobacteraceae bacterium]